MERSMNCAVCGHFFEVFGLETVCRGCIEKDMNDFDRIRDYLYSHPMAKVFEVSNNLDITVPKIKRYLKEGRLEIVEKDNVFLKCEQCGKPVCSGTKCDDCLSQSTHDYKSTFTSSNTTNKKTKVTYAPLNKK